MTAASLFGTGRRDKRSAGKAPLGGPRPRGLFRSFRHFYKQDFGFRTVADCAIVGMIALAFMEPPLVIRPLALVLGVTYESVTGSRVFNVVDLNVFLADFDLEAAPSAAKVKIDTAPFAKSWPEDKEKLHAAIQARNADNPERVLEILQSADGDDPNVRLLRGLALLQMAGPDSAFVGRQTLQAAADSGQAQALGILGALDLRAPETQKRGREQLETAAERGDAYAAYALAVAYKSGSGGLVDLARSAKYLQMAAAKNFPNALTQLSFYYGKGIGVPQDSAIAERTFVQAAEKGDVKAQAVLGLFHFFRYTAGWDWTPAESIRWYKMAAEANDPHAMAYLSQILTRHTRPPYRDEAKGADYARRCAALWEKDCISVYADMLKDGVGVRQDVVEARVYYDLSSRLRVDAWGRQDLAKLQALDRSLSPAQVALARERADALMKTRPPEAR